MKFNHDHKARGYCHPRIQHPYYGTHLAARKKCLEGRGDYENMGGPVQILFPCHHSTLAAQPSQAASGTSIGGAFYVTLDSLIRIKVLGVKWRGPVTLFGLKLDILSLELT
jgi:hypothetical protein